MNNVQKVNNYMDKDCSCLKITVISQAAVEWCPTTFNHILQQCKKCLSIR
jgi:hypothetical protein